VASHEAEADGCTPEVLQIDVDTFRYWCAMVKVVPGIDALKAYAIAKRNQGGAGMPPPSMTA